jgi:hypothetical protein
MFPPGTDARGLSCTRPKPMRGFELYPPSSKAEGIELSRPNEAIRSEGILIPPETRAPNRALPGPVAWTRIDRDPAMGRAG